MLLYNGRNKTKDTDILHRTKMTKSVLERAAEIQAELAKELQVGNSKYLAIDV
jgi:hypothetical protein